MYSVVDFNRLAEHQVDQNNAVTAVGRHSRQYYGAIRVGSIEKLIADQQGLIGAERVPELKIGSVWRADESGLCHNTGGSHPNDGCCQPENYASEHISFLC